MERTRCIALSKCPPGVPVATVAINGSKNAGILAAQIIGASNTEVLKRVEAFKANMEQSVLDKASRLEDVGFKSYLSNS